MLLLPALACGQANYAPYTFTTLAGMPSLGHADGRGAAARFQNPAGIAAGPGGNLYVADAGNDTIRTISADGTVTTLAGQAGVWGSADGVGSAARFYSPGGVAVDGAGNVYVADTVNHAIRKVTPDGIVTTLAGRADAPGSADGRGSDARFAGPRGLAVDAAGILYVADPSSQTIRRVTPDGTVTTLAGSAGLGGSADGAGRDARFNNPRGLAMDAAANLYIADTGNCTIRRITPGGAVTTLAGLAGVAGDADGAARDARFNSPCGLTVDGAGNVYVADSGNHTIRRIAPDGVVTTLAGAAGIAGGVDGIGGSARFDRPVDVALAAGGVLFVADGGNAIRRIAPDGTVTTWAGVMRSGGSTDGAPGAAQFAQPFGVAVDTGGNTYVADTSNHTIRKIALSGNVTTLAGLAGAPGSADGAGPAARFNGPQGIAVDASGSVFVADTGNHTVRRIAPDGTVTTVAGSAGDAGLVDGPADLARFSAPNSLGVDGAGNVYVLDAGNVRIRKISPAGMVTSLNPYIPPTWGLGLGGIAVDAARNVYAAMRFYYEGFDVFKITPAGSQSDVTRGMAFADVTNAGLAIDAAGGVYVAHPRGAIYRIALDGIVATIAGDYTNGFADGVGTAAEFDAPRGIAVDAAGTVFVADTRNNAIRRGRIYAMPVITRDPEDWTTTSGQDAKFWVFEGSSSAAVLRWQRKAAGATDWVDLREDGAFSGTTTTSLTVHGTTASMNGDAYRFVIANASGSLASAPATLIVLATPQLTVATLAGQAGASGSTDGIGGAARFHSPGDLAVDAAGVVYVADTAGQIIRRVAADGTVTTLAGTPDAGGYADGPARSALFANPAGVAVDGAGNVYVSDTDNSVIRRITPAGTVTTLAGLAHSPGSADGVGSAARFNGPSGIVVDAGGNGYAADTLNRTIRKIAPDRTVTTVAGRFGNPSSLLGPQGLALADADHLYVVDTNSNTVQRVVLSTGVVTTVAGSGAIGDRDGPAAAASFNFPSGIAVDRAGNLYVADTDSHVIRQITPGGTVSTVAGHVDASGSADGIGAAARFNHPTAIAVDAAGRLYIADTDNHTIRVAYFAATPAITTQPQSQTVTPGASATFSVATAGQPAPTFQWNFNGAAIAGATGSTLSLANVQPANAGSYTVTVSNASGSVTSNSAILTVNAAAPPPGGSGSPSGGGATSLWFLAALLILAVLRSRRIRPVRPFNFLPAR